MYLIDSSSNKYFQGFAHYVKERLGDECEITDDYSRKGTWVLNFVSFKNGVHKKIIGDYIAIQTEQMNAKGTDAYINFLAEAKSIWDWKTNFKIGYADYWRLEMEDAKDIDVLFYGALNERRRNILDAIAIFNPGIRMEILTNVYGANLQSYVMCSKIVLSIHHYENPDNDMPRIAPLLSNRSFVIAEKCNEDWFNDIHDITIRPTDEIPGCVTFYLNNPLKRLEMIDRGYDFIKKFR